MKPRHLLAVLALLTAFGLGGGRSPSALASGPEEDESPFTWIAEGDHLDKPVEGLVQRMVAAKPAFVVGTGDLVFESQPQDYEALKRLVIDPLAKVGARFYPVVGNHDFPVQPHWFGFWKPPADRLYYSFDYGNSHFVILDTNTAFLSEGQPAEGRTFEPGSEEYAIQTQAAGFEPGSAQYEWLKKDLAATRKTHIFVFFHEPAFSYGGHDGSPAIQRVLCPLFEKYRVTAVFSGHSHGYERFQPLRVDLSSGRSAAVPDAKVGVVYIVTAGGGKPLYDITRDRTHAAVAKAFHFVRVDVRDRVAHCSVIEAKTGKLLDKFDLRSRRQ